MSELKRLFLLLILLYSYTILGLLCMFFLTKPFSYIIVPAFIVGIWCVAKTMRRVIDK